MSRRVVPEDTVAAMPVPLDNRLQESYHVLSVEVLLFLVHEEQLSVLRNRCDYAVSLIVVREMRNCDVLLRPAPGVGTVRLSTEYRLIHLPDESILSLCLSELLLASSSPSIDFLFAVARRVAGPVPHLLILDAVLSV